MRERWLAGLLTAWLPAAASPAIAGDGAEPVPIGVAADPGYPSPQSPYAPGQIAYPAGMGAGMSGLPPLPGQPSPYPQYTPGMGAEVPGAGVPGAGTPGASPFDFGAADLGAGGAAPFDFGGGGPGVGGGLGGFGGETGGALAMLGDMSPFASLRQVTIPQPPPIPPINPPGPTPPNLPNVARTWVLPSVRGLKIAENMSPFPQDRLFYNFNYFYNVNKDLNNFFQSPVQGMNIWRHILGFEKTFNRGMGSFGIRMPIDTINAVARPSIAGQLPVGGTYTSVGNITIFLKHILWYDAQAGHMVSAGFAITPPTGPSQFAGAPYLLPSRTTELQPFVGYYFTFGRWYLHGFSSIAAPTNYNLPTYIYNDIGLGYWAYRSNQLDQLITGVIPTFEVHVNDPLNHKNPYSRTDLYGSPDIVNLTAGLNIELFGSAVLTGGVVTPVTGPQPFDVEAIALLNWRFGATRARRQALPVLGQ